jgi:hypothetical protein
MQHHLELKGRLLFLSCCGFSGSTTFTPGLVSPILPLLEDEFVISHARAAEFHVPVGGYGISLFAGLYALGYKKCIVLSFAVASGVFS